jgi:cytochrome c-type biogenesis protein CcmE
MIWVAIVMAVVIMTVAVGLCLYAIDHEIKVVRLTEEEFKGIKRREDDHENHW